MLLPGTFHIKRCPLFNYLTQLGIEKVSGSVNNKPIFSFHFGLSHKLTFCKMTFSLWRTADKDLIKANVTNHDEVMPFW